MKRTDKCQHKAEIVKFLVPQGKIEAFRSRLGKWIVDVWQPKTSRATRRRHIVIRDPVPEVQFSDEEADTRIALHAWPASRRQCDALWYTDTDTGVFVLLLACSKNSTLPKRCYTKKGRGANFLCNSTQVMLTTASWRALIGVNSITGLDNICAFFG